MRIPGCELACLAKSYNKDQHTLSTLPCYHHNIGTIITSSRVLGLDEDFLHCNQHLQVVLVLGIVSSTALAVVAQSYPYVYHVPTPCTSAADSDDDFIILDQ